MAVSKIPKQKDYWYSRIAIVNQTRFSVDVPPTGEFSGYVNLMTYSLGTGLHMDEYYVLANCDNGNLSVSSDIDGSLTFSNISLADGKITFEFSSQKSYMGSAIFFQA